MDASRSHLLYNFSLEDFLNIPRKCLINLSTLIKNLDSTNDSKKQNEKPVFKCKTHSGLVPGIYNEILILIKKKKIQFKENGNVIH